MADEQTPFIDSLTTDRRTIVAKKSKGTRRPTYFDATLAATQTAAVKEGQTEVTDFLVGRVQISLDLEAALILASREVKQGMINFIRNALQIVTNVDADDFALMEEVVAVRTKSYEQVSRDVGRSVSEYDSTRASFLSSIDENARSGSGDVEEATSVVLTDIGPLFASLSDARTTMSRPDELSVHDRIADAGITYTYQNAGTTRSKELSSWIDIITAYLI